MRKSFILMILIIFCLCVPYVRADMHEVWPDPNGNSLKEKIKDDAVKNGDIIIAHPGEYEYNGFKFYGKAIIVMSEDPNDPNTVSKTVITGESERRAIAFVDGEGNDSVLKGFTIHNGEGIHGGGIYCSGSSPTIEKCTIEENTSENHGGGIKCENASPKIIECTITDNNASEYGGGIYCDPNSDPLIELCKIKDNTASAGAGIYCDSSSPMISKCSFKRNTAQKKGGGIFCYNSGALITNCLIRNNNANGKHGGGVYCEMGSSPTIIYSDIIENNASKCGGVAVKPSSDTIAESFVTIKNSVIWSNESTDPNWNKEDFTETCDNNICGDPNSSDTFDVTYSNINWKFIQGEPFKGEGNINSAPKYTNPSQGLKALDSPCIDRALCNPNNIAIDKFGSIRPLDGNHDGCIYFTDPNYFNDPNNCKCKEKDENNDCIERFDCKNCQKLYECDMGVHEFDFHQGEAEILDEAKDNIERIRKATVKLELEDQNCAFVSGAQVHIEQIKHEFLFGSAFLGKAHNAKRYGYNKFRKIKPSQGHFLGVEQGLYKEFLKRFFDFANYVYLYAYWPLEEPKSDKDYYIINDIHDNEIKFLHDHGIKVAAHTLLYQWNLENHNTVTWLPNDPVQADKIFQIFEERIRHYVSYYKGKFDSFGIVNEPAQNYSGKDEIDRCYDKWGRSKVNYWFFKIAKEENPNARLMSNGLKIGRNVFGNPDDFNDPNKTFYGQLRAIEQELKNDPDNLGTNKSLSNLIDVIGIQTHMRTTLWSISQVKECCDLYGDFNIPLQFSEVTVFSCIPLYGRINPDCIPPGSVKDPNDIGEEPQKEYVVNFYTTLFGHEAVEAIVWFDLSDKWVWGLAKKQCDWYFSRPAGLLTKDMKPKKAYTALMDLIKGEWWTTCQADQKPEGYYEFDAFYGDYKITVNKDGKSKTFYRKIRKKDGKIKEINLKW